MGKWKLLERCTVTSAKGSHQQQPGSSSLSTIVQPKPFDDRPEGTVVKLDKDNGERHRCDPCNFSFRSNYLLRVHARIIHSQKVHIEHKCKRCNATFGESSVLRAHQLRDCYRRKPSKVNWLFSCKSFLSFINYSLVLETKITSDIHFCPQYCCK